MHDVEPSEYLKAGVEYLNDSLSGIYSEKPKTQCLASHLFSELTAADKISILEQIDFDVDFDALEARYYLDKIVK